MKQPDDEQYIPEPQGDLGPAWDDLLDQAEELKRKVGDPEMVPWITIVLLGHIGQALSDSDRSW